MGKRAEEASPDILPLGLFHIEHIAFLSSYDFHVSGGEGVSSLQRAWEWQDLPRNSPTSYRHLTTRAWRDRACQICCLWGSEAVSLCRNDSEVTRSELWLPHSTEFGGEAGEAERKEAGRPLDPTAFS